MHYPFWFVPFLTSPMLIAAIAVAHVFVSMFAVGGGLVLAGEVEAAWRRNDRAYLDYLRSFTRFFVLITVVFGAVSGVGIWWVISLASPLATEELISIFVFGWAMEWVTFIVEIVAAFILYYRWERLDPASHRFVAWTYAAAAWASLVIITAITGFMLNPGRWLEVGGFWTAVANPQLIPQALARTGAAFLLAGLYISLHASFRLRDDPDLSRRVEHRVGGYAIFGAVLMIAGGLLWFPAMPAAAQAVIQDSPTLNFILAFILAISLLVFLMMYVGPFRNPTWLSPGFSILFFCIGLTATGLGEFLREGARKPYVVYGRILGNGVRVEELDEIKRDGLLESGLWTRIYVARNHPGLIGADGRIDETRLPELDKPDRIGLGRVIFQYHCNDCHSVFGFNGVGRLTRGWNRELIDSMIENLDRIKPSMPPWIGTGEEAVLLGDYLESIALSVPGREGD